VRYTEIGRIPPTAHISWFAGVLMVAAGDLGFVSGPPVGVTFWNDRVDLALVPDPPADRVSAQGISGRRDRGPESRYIRRAVRSKTASRSAGLSWAVSSRYRSQTWA
jgi:hypothetical protein